MTEARPSDYWLSNSALYIQLNAVGDYDYIHANCSSGSKVMCYMRGIDGLGYDNAHNYRRWSLKASPTVFHDNGERYVYIAIPRDSKVTEAQVVFPSQHIDIYGNDESGNQVASGAFFYIFTQGIITASVIGGVQTPRQWKSAIDTGTLASDEAIAAGGDGTWWRWDSISDTVTFLKDIAKATFRNLTATFANITQMILNGHLINGVADENTPDDADDKLLTPKSAHGKFLSRVSDDEAAGHIKFNDGLTSKKKVMAEAGVQIGGSFAPGLTGFGGLIDGNANGELESLSLRRFLEVPELRYNRVVIQIGNKWNAPGGGIVQSCVPDVDASGNVLPSGMVTLHLEDGEIGTVAVDDICMGIFHDGFNTANNATDDYDDSVGNFHFAGFYTCYFRITDIVETGRNSVFRYALRPVSDRWKFQMHPCEAMHFVGYGNFNDKTRQTSRYSTRTYERYLRDVNDWEFSAVNIGAQFGDLTNLTVFGLQMKGYSAYLNNIYMTGTIDKLEALFPRMEIETDGDYFLAYGETCNITCRVYRGWKEVTSEVVKWEVTRDSGDPADDASWLLRPKVKNFNGKIEICFTPTENDLGSNSLVSSTLFSFRALLPGDAEATTTLTI